MQHYARGRVIGYEDTIVEGKGDFKGKEELLSLNRLTITARGNSELGRIRDDDPLQNVPMLNQDDSKQVLNKMNEVIKPFEMEDVKCPTQHQVWGFTKQRLPFLSWIPLTTWNSARADVVAGLTILVMAIPQSMSYSDIAGLPLVHGLYATMVPCLIYALTGNCRQLAVGPTALTAILSNAALDGLLTSDECPVSSNQNVECPEQYVKLAAVLALATGVLQVGAAIFQLGFIVQFLGQPVVSGFTSAAAFLIALTQVRNLLGFSIERSQFIYVTIGEIINNIHKTNPINAVLGFSFFFMLRAFSAVSKKYKTFAFLRPTGPLILCVVASVIVYAADLDTTHDVGVVGEVPQGLPPPTLDFTGDEFQRVIVPAITLVVFSYMVAIANGKTLAALNGYEIEAGQELFALGSMNVFTGMFSGFPITGSFSRCSVAQAVGAKTQLFGFVTGIGMILALVLLTPIFAYLPNFILGAIVLSSVVNLVAYEDAIQLWKVKKSDCFLWFLAFFGTLFLGILFGVVLAVIISIVIVIYESVRPQVSLIWRVQGTSYFRSVKQAPNGQWVKGVLIVRFGAPMYFANMSYIRDTIFQLVSKDDTVRYVILEMSPVISIDSSALNIMKDMNKEFIKRGLHLCFANTGNRALSLIKRSGWYEKHGAEWFCESTAAAVSQCQRHKKLGRRRNSEGPDYENGGEESKNTSV
mmetsp:Transcript_23747/g.33212  ORF Transcript_23747/g.33212 Transcript_23747/m.33212 type:complete len:696 (+) Transcript_23747:51-2138(+)|eukprot:CAMPEP_0184493100 /NCGR_PEP_ID=MMETSP0113_2-20130426/25072_1 /TAXON_ID=91329 /ORGANISM="Norrisiella sphaerica, Strain BC52" /LENGTH=695 /DNA_ID=CAMNT_0026878229 /DNA_START=51 /DNA_END=2138 /DNA_ORIENTATION=+